MVRRLKTMARNMAKVVAIVGAWVAARQSCFRASIDLEDLCRLLHQPEP